MSEDFQLALQLLAIGMITVFMILFLVVQSARILISFVNRFMPLSAVTVVLERTGGKDTLDPKVVAAISGAVSHLTEGRGTVKSITRKENK